MPIVKSTAQNEIIFINLILKEIGFQQYNAKYTFSHFMIGTIFSLLNSSMLNKEKKTNKCINIHK